MTTPPISSPNITSSGYLICGQVACRWCRAPATALRDAVQLCRACAAVVDELAEHARRHASGA